MNVLVLYLLLLKATLTSFSGLASLPVVRNDLVLTRNVLTDHQLNAAVAVGRITPGPAGLYVVSVGYFVDGIPGAIAGWLALITPSFLVILLLRYLARRAEQPRLKSVLSSVMLAGAGLLLASSVPLAQEALGSALLLGIAIISCLLLTATRIEGIWVILGAGLFESGLELIASYFAVR